jgi:23S rRNA pseudouridine2605 synthase
MLERVQKIIANAGYCSRRKAEELIEKRKVLVNGKMIKLGDKADLDHDDILVEGHSLEKTKSVYIMLNKPRHYEVTISPLVRRNIMELVQVNARVFPVGRLDKNTTGMLLLTNDGNFANKITHPRYEKEKTYHVKLDKRLEDEDKKEIESGVNLSDGWIKGKIKMYSKDTLEITIHEGKKWILKRLFFKLGYYIEELSRTRIGNLRLDVKIGKWRYLTKREVDELMK